MLTSQQLDEAVQRIVRHASRPARVILFGSYARGETDVLHDAAA